MKNGNEQMEAKKHIVLVGGAGGHGEQLNRIRKYFSTATVTVIGEPDLKWSFPEDTRINVDRVVDYHTSKKIQPLLKFASGLSKAYKALKGQHFDLLVSTGPSMAIPACIIAKLFGIKVVHIESWSRVGSISKTTKMIRLLNLADVVAYQYRDHALAGKKKCEFWGHL